METTRRGYELYASGDLEGIAALFSPDAEMADSGGLGLVDSAAGTLHGPQGFLQSVREGLEAFEDYRVEPEDFVDAGEAVVVSVRISGRGRTSGAELEMHVAHLWVFAGNGQAIRGEVYRTTEEALEASGARGDR